MAVCRISLRKEFSGDPLFDGVSFSVGRETDSLWRSDGAGKTALLRAIVGETSLQAGGRVRGDTGGPP
jgi:ATPase subunit of ABC transporter with duplicated ATPase domains